MSLSDNFCLSNYIGLKGQMIDKNVRLFIQNDLERKDLMLKSIQIANGKAFGEDVPEDQLRELLKDIEKQMECDIREFKEEAGDKLTENST